MKTNLENWKRRTVESCKKAYSRFVKIRGNPREIALGFALGLFVGMSPFMGAHTIIAESPREAMGDAIAVASVAMVLFMGFMAPVLF